MGIHDGHRERMKVRFQKNGLDAFDDHSVLEFILFYSMPRIDTNDLAHRLINHFGGLDAVFEAPIDELLKVKGLGKSSAILIRLIPEAAKRYQVVKAHGNIILNSTESAGEYLIPHFLYERDEVVIAVCLDAKLKVITCREISRGVTNSTNVSIRKIVEFALSQNASSILLSHNHTSGIAIPSADDKLTTKQIKTALDMVGIWLVDHIVVAGDDFVSMRDSGLL